MELTGGFNKVDELIEDMLKYLKTGNTNSLLKGEHFEDEDTSSFHVMITEVLSWLKLGYKRELWKQERKYVKHKPLSINLSYTWCRILKQITENDQRYSRYFTITDKEFDFRETVSDQKRIEAMKIVYDKFNLQGRS